MRLWTIQPVSVLNELNEKGYFICAPEKAGNISDGSFTPAYKWMVSEMEKKVGARPSEVSYPVWAWHTTDWKHKKPDLRRNYYAKKGETCVCLEIEVPDEEVVLSDFNCWHDILSMRYSDNSMNEEEWEKEMEWFEKLPASEKEVEMRKSWNKIFDIAPFKNDWTERGRFVQATFWILHLSYVRKVQFFKGR